MPPIPRLTKLLMMVCAGIFLVSELLGQWLPLTPWLALWTWSSGHFMPWQLVTYALLHNDIGHLLINLLVIWFFGGEMERLFGERRYGHLLLACAVSAGLTHMVVRELIGGSPVVAGSSGVGFGLLVAYALYFPNRRFDLVMLLPMLLTILPSQFLSTLGLVLFVVLLVNRQAVPIAPVMVDSLKAVSLIGLALLVGGLLTGNAPGYIPHLGGVLGGWLMVRYWRGQAPFPAKKRW